MACVPWGLSLLRPFTPQSSNHCYIYAHVEKLRREIDASPELFEAVGHNGSKMAAAFINYRRQRHKIALQTT